MSEGTQGPGWWQASDGQWYPPEQHPDFDAGATQPIEAMSSPPPTAAMPIPPPMPPPGGPPPGPPPGAPVGPPPGTPGAGSNNAKWIIAGVLAVAAVAIAAFLLLGGDNKKDNVAATSSSSSSSSSSSKSSSSKSSSSSSKSSSSSSVSPSDLQARMLTASDVGPGFVDDTFTPDTDPTNCGEPNPNETFPPKGIVGSQSSNGTAGFREEAIAYSSSSDAQKVLEIYLAQPDCPNPTVAGGGPMVFSQRKDVSSSMTTPVESAFEIDFQTEEAQGQAFVIKDGVAIVVFTFATQKGSDTSQLPTAISLVNKGLAKIVNG